MGNHYEVMTSNFANHQRYSLAGISICRYPSRDFQGPEFLGLAPNHALITDYKDGIINWEAYKKRYYYEVIQALDPEKTLAVLKRLAQGRTPILLCFESSKTLDTQPCHRRLVAAWFNKKLGIEVPEWTKGM